MHWIWTVAIGIVVLQSGTGCALEEQPQSLVGQYELSAAPQGGDCNLSDDQRRAIFDRLVFRVEGSGGDDTVVRLQLPFYDTSEILMNAALDVTEFDPREDRGVIGFDALQTGMTEEGDDVFVATRVEVGVVGVEVKGSAVVALASCAEPVELEGLRTPE